MGYCSECRFGTLSGISVMCTHILQDAIIVGRDRALFEFEIAHVILPMTFSCRDFEDKNNTIEEEIT